MLTVQAAGGGFVRSLGRILTVAVMVLLVGAPWAASQVIFSGTYSQNFDALASSGTSNGWTNNVTLTGWHVFQALPGGGDTSGVRNGTTNAVTTYRGDSGSSGTGALYSWGTAAGDRALGTVASGTPGDFVIALVLQNNTGSTITSVALRYDSEQWRNGGNTTQQFSVLDYRTFAGIPTASDMSATTTGYTVPGTAYNVISKVNTATAAPVDGNVAGRTDNQGGPLNVTWNNGEYLVIRWWDDNDAGNDHGLAVDNVTVGSPTFQATDATPESAKVDGIHDPNEYGPGDSYAFAGGGTAFGGILGNGTLYFNSDGANLHVGFQPGGGGLGSGTDVVVVYLDSKGGGFTDATISSDTSTIERRAVTDLGAFGNEVFPLGFAPDYAVTFSSNGPMAWQLGSSISSLANTNANGSGAGTGFREITIPHASMGLNASSPVHFFAALVNGTNGFLSNESIPPSTALNSGGNPGTSAIGTYAAFDQFTTVNFTAAVVTTKTDCEPGGATTNGSLDPNEYGPNNAYAYSGGGAGFNGAVGAGTVYMNSDNTNLYIGFQPGAALNNDIAVIYLNTTTGGQDDSTMTDIGSTDRKVISNLTNSIDDAFPFKADFAISVWNAAGGAFLYSLGTSTHTFVSNANLTTLGTNDSAAFREMSIPLATLGLSAGGNVDFFVAYCSNSNFNSNESIPDSLGAFSSPGFAGPTPGYSKLDRFVVYNSATGVTINTPPSNQTVCQGSGASFSVSASGTGLTYQWRKNGGDIGGATSATYSIPSTALADAGSYDVVVTVSSGCTATSTAATLVINASTAITGQPVASQTICEGDSASMTVAAAGTSLSYQWRKGGTPLSNGGHYGNVTTPTLDISMSDPNDNGSYDCVVSGTCGTLTSNASSLTVSPTTEISIPPQTQTACENGSVTFSVTAAGASLTFQWRIDTAPIDGATSSSYTINPVHMADAGSYDCVVTGACGTETSAAAALTVNAATAILDSTGDQTVCQDTPVNFQVSATGTNLTYQWRKDASPLSDGGHISGVSTATLLIDPTDPNDNGSYDCVVTGTCGTLTTTAATLTVNAPTVMVTDPNTPQTACDGGSVTFSVSATGASLTYQWRKDSSPIGGATSSSLTIDPVSLSDAGSYDCIVSGACGGATSAAATLTVNETTAINIQPQPQTVCEGTPTSFSVTASGTNLTYGWRKNGAAINDGGTYSGTQTANLSIAAPHALEQGTYDCVIGGACGDLYTDPVTLTINATTSVTDDPNDVTVFAGQPASFSITAAGAALTYQWRKDSVAISGATASTYSIAATLAGDAGSYDCEVSGACGTATSAPATLTVNASTASAALSLFAAGGCHAPGSTLTVEVNMSAATTPIVGGQFFLSYDPNYLGFTSADPGDAPYTNEIYESVDDLAGTIDYGVGIPFPGGVGVTGSRTMARIQFTVLSGHDACGVTGLVSFRAHTPPSRLTDSLDAELSVANGNLSLNHLNAVTIHSTLPVVTAPTNIDVQADAGGCSATLNVGTASASDACSGSLSASGTRSDGHLLSDPYPQGSTTIVWSATDDCGLTGTDEQTVTVSDKNVLRVNVELQGVSEPTVKRCITFELFNCTTNSTVLVSEQLTFDAGIATAADVLVPCGSYECVTARDTLHTLRRTDGVDFGISGSRYVADFTSSGADGNDSLLGGNFNDDDFVDIIDFAIYVNRFGVNYGTSDTLCGPAPYQADITGDGLVDTSDFTYLQINFLNSHEADCCEIGLLGTPRTSITVAELRQLGMGNLAPADLTADGVIDALDIQAFANGVRPAVIRATPGAAVKVKSAGTGQLVDEP